MGENKLAHHALENMDSSDAIQLEDTLWWARGRKHIIRLYLEKAKAWKAIGSIMDVGCGSGGVFGVLNEFGTIIGVESSRVLADRARSRGVAAKVRSENFLSMPTEERVDLITMFDVLEHIEDDRLWVRRLREHTVSNHLVLVSVPACPSLYGAHDRLLHHFRRYTREGLERVFFDGGYDVVQSGHFMTILFPVAWISRWLQRMVECCGGKYTEVKIASAPRPISVCMELTLRLEAWLSRRISLPWGLWIFLLARYHGADGEEKAEIPGAFHKQKGFSDDKNNLERVGRSEEGAAVRI